MANRPKDHDKAPHGDEHGDVVFRPLPGNIAIGSRGAGLVMDGVDPATGDHAITADVDGARSTSRLKKDGTVSLDLEGAAAVGRRGEPRAIRTLRQRLQADGHTVSVGLGRDDRGEDSILTINEVNYVLQIVTAPGLSVFWQQASAGAATSDVNVAGAVEWIRRAIESKARKTPPGERPCMVLALHAQHAGILADDCIIGTYLKQFDTPRAEFGFAAVWVVGPTVSRCVRVGD